MAREKQEPRPAYHRRNDLKRLQDHALELPVIVVDVGAGQGYEVRTLSLTPLLRGRYEVVYAYLTGWRHGAGLHNG